MKKLGSLFQKKNNQNKSPQPSKSKKKTKKKPFTTVQKQGNIKSYTINGNAIKYGDTIIYLSQHSTLLTNDDIKLNNENTDTTNNNKSANNTITLNKYNLKTKQMISSIDLNTSKYNIDISNSVYCINTQNNSIYLINKNTQLFSISMTDNPLIKPLNFIDPENNITAKPIESRNIASIAYYNNTVTVFGAIAKPDNDEKSNYEDKNIRYIPFDLTKIKQEEDHLAITKFGKDCSIFAIPELNRIFLWGGKTFWGKTDIYIPSNTIFGCSMNGNGQHKWGYGPLYLAESSHSFGIVHLNLKHYRWLLFFGGTHVHSKKEVELPMNAVYAIYFDKKYEKLSIEELIKLEKKQTRNKKSSKKNNSNGVSDIGLHGLWVEMGVILPEKANYCSFYDEKMDKDLIHLISRNSGNHYTISVTEVLQLLDKKKLFTKDGMDGTVHKCQPWTEAGKNPIPTKLAKLKTTGPKKKDKGNKGKMVIGRKVEVENNNGRQNNNNVKQNVMDVGKNVNE